MDIRVIEGKAPGASENTAFTIGFKMPVRPIDANALKTKAHITRTRALDNLTIETLNVSVDEIENAPSLSLNTLRDAIYQDAVEHGLWEDKFLLCQQTDVVTDEVMELLSASSAITLAQTEKGKKRVREHFNEELADVVIGCFLLAGKLGIDIDAAVKKKMEINKARPWKHGKA